MKKVYALLVIVALFLGCSSAYDKKLKISVNAWVGYAPIFYAYDKGWLKPYNIDIISLTSLAESMYLYDAGNSDALTGTQYEYKELKKNHPALTALMFFDRSYGGDMILCNLSLHALQKSSQEIDVYLEIDSVNSELIKDFIRYYHLEDKKLHFINREQSVISELSNNHPEKPTLIVTYAPYNIELQKRGFKTIASTRDGLTLTVIDALFATQKDIAEHEKQFKALKVQTDKAIEVLKNDPKEFYTHVKNYLDGISYEDFKATLLDIKWINQSIEPSLKKRIEAMGIALNGLI